MESAVVVVVPKRRGRKRKNNDLEDAIGQKKAVATRTLRLVGRYVRKEFEGNGVFLGKIMSYDSGLYRVNYEDGDCEDLDSSEVKLFLVEDADLIGELSETKEKLDKLLLRKNINAEILRVENILEAEVSRVKNTLELANTKQADFSLLSGQRNGEVGAENVNLAGSSLLNEMRMGGTGANDGVEDHIDGDSDSSNDACEDTHKEQPLVPPPELPPSSGNIGIPEEYVSHLLSVHSFLRSFSVPLFLYPFGLDDFVGALNCSVANTLLDSIHVALLCVLKRHIEMLCLEGSELALKCMRCLDWNLLDNITWPFYLVHYLIVMGLKNDPEWKEFYAHSLERDYYTLSAGKKLTVLQILCDNLLDSELLRAEMDMREESEVGIDMDTSAIVKTTGAFRRVHPRHTKISASKEIEAINFEEYHETKSSLGSHSSLVGGPLQSSADDDNNADECSICGMEGVLLCCDGCPSSYHSRCIGLNKMHMPEGSWYCPECKINATEPKILQGTTLQAGHSFGVDVYGLLFIASCDHLLVLNSSIDSGVCLRYYNRSDIPKVVHSLCSKSEHAAIYLEICKGVVQYWQLPEEILPQNEISEVGVLLEHEAGGGDYSLTHRTEVEKIESCVTTVCAADKAAFKQTSSLGLLGQHADTNGSSQQRTFNVMETLNYPTRIRISVTSLKPNNTVPSEPYGSPCDGLLCIGSSFNKNGYLNNYLHGDFAASAAAKLRILSSEENQVLESRSSNNRRKVTENIALQIKAFSSVSMPFFWPNSEKKLVDVPRERCSWCFSCKALVSSKRGCLLNAAASNAIRGSMRVLSGGRPVKIGDGRLSGIATHIMLMEESLSGLVIGPFLNDTFRKRWRKQVEQSTSCNAIKILLLELEENLRPISLSGDWVKLVDGCSTQSSTSQIATNAAGSSQKRRPGRPGRKPATVVDVTTDDCQNVSKDFTWWRGGGTLSKLMFQRGNLPHSIIRKAARQGGSKKISGIQYVEGLETLKLSRQLIWRSAVEMSRNLAQLALQVRYLDFHVRWSDLVRPEQSFHDGKGPEAEASAFRNASICEKEIMGHEIRYCIAFGSQKHLPSRLMKKIDEIDQTLDDGQKRYWFSETRIPLYLIKEYEGKTEKSTTVNISKLQMKQRKPSFKNIFSYLSRKQDNSTQTDCSSCHCDVLHREAVRCTTCQGFCHEQCIISSNVRNNEEVALVITCKNCSEPQAITQIQNSYGSPTSPLLLQGQDFPKAGTSRKCGKLVGNKGPSSSVGTGEYSSQTKPSNDSATAKKGNNKNWGLRWGRKDGEAAGINFRLKHVLPRGNPDMNMTKPVCKLCNELYNPELMYIQCESCQHWFHADALELDESRLFELVGFKCCKCRRIRHPVCPYLDPVKKKALEHKIESKTAKLDITATDCNSRLSKNLITDARVYSTLPTKEEVEPPEVKYEWVNSNASHSGPLKLKIRRHNKQDTNVLLPPPDPFQVNVSAPDEANFPNSTGKLPVRRHMKGENNLDCSSAISSFQVESSSPLEVNAMNPVLNQLSSDSQWDVSEGSFDDGITLDYGFQDMDFEPQTFFSFNELLASDDDGHANVDELPQNVENLFDIPENGTVEISYDEEEPIISIGTTFDFVPCSICYRTDPYPDLSCQKCGVWIHSHCSPLLESPSWENTWRCGNCHDGM